MYFFQYLPLFSNQWTWKPLKITWYIRTTSCDHKEHHNLSLEQILGLKMALSHHRNGIKSIFWDKAIFKPKICSQWHIMVLLVVRGCRSDVPSCFQRFPGPLVAKKWKKLGKMQKNILSHFHSVQGHIKLLKFDP